MNEKVILCAGGGLRFSYMCRELCGFGRVYSVGVVSDEEGVTLLVSPVDMAVLADVLVLPMMGGGLKVNAGGEEIGFDRLTRRLKQGALVLGGRLSAEQKAFFESYGFICEDYFARESLVIKNCLPTAEGALQIALNETAETVFGSRVLVLGYGRTAKCCARLFKAVGADCTVCARRAESLADAWTEGFETFYVKELRDRAADFDIIINTVPALLLTEEVLSDVQKNVLIIDLASKPGGTDFLSAERLGVKAIHALALPEKTAPASAGRLLGEAVGEIFSERWGISDKR